MSSGSIERQGGYICIKVPVEHHQNFVVRLQGYEIHSDIFSTDGAYHHIMILLPVNQRATCFECIQNIGQELSCPMPDATSQLA